MGAIVFLYKVTAVVKSPRVQLIKASIVVVMFICLKMLETKPQGEFQEH